jgi:hypothetical protein
MIPLSLVAGGSTLKGVTSCILGASTLTAGDFGLSIIHPLMMFPISVAGASHCANFLNLLMPTVQTGACLGWATFAASTTFMQPTIFATLVEN